MERVKGETVNDRNDRAIREGSRWYDEHLSTPKKNRIRTVLLTDDAGNREKAIASGLLACSGNTKPPTIFLLRESMNTVYVCAVSDYVKSLTDYPGLQDKLAHKNYDLESSKVSLFPPHLTPADIHERIKNGSLLQGAFQASRENYLEGSVNVEGYEKFVSHLCSIKMIELKNIIN